MRLTRFFFSTSVFLCSLTTFAQVATSPYPVSKIFENKTTAKNKFGTIKAQKVKGKVNGTGMAYNKDGGLYVGDFIEKIPTGKGMVLAAPNTDITGCKNGAFFVGRFKEGLKNGKGRVYDRNGVLIYEGRFKDDMPVESYPASLPDSIRFSELKSSNSTYLGEQVSGIPSGFGVLIFPDGSFMVSNYVLGEREGVSVYIRNDGGWFSENVENGEIKPISSSDEYAAVEAAAKAAFRSALMGALSELSNSAVGIANTISAYKAYTSGANSYSSDSNYSGSSSSKQSGKASSTGNRYNISEQESFNTAKRSYANYDSLLSQIFAGNRSASLSEIKDIQNKMRNLREKWAAKGKTIPVSSNENK